MTLKEIVKTNRQSMSQKATTLMGFYFYLACLHAAAAV